MTTEYNHQAKKWQRDSPKHLSDFVARPVVLEIIKKDIGNKRTYILDAGCGEGYFTRQLALLSKGIVGVDNSKGMITLARERENPLGIEYFEGDVTNLKSFKENSFDYYVSNHVFQHLSPKEKVSACKEIERVITDRGRFIVLVPHPAFTLAKQRGKAIKYNVEEWNYTQSRGKYFKGTMQTVKGDTFEVGHYHETIGDYLDYFRKAGLSIDKIVEPVVTTEIANKFPLFKELEEETLHIIFSGEVKK